MILELFLLDNFLMNFLIVTVAGMLASKMVRKWGSICACTLMSIIAAFAQSIAILLSLPAKIIMLSMMCVTCFHIGSWSDFIKCWLGLLVSTFLFGGAAYGMAFACGGIQNGIVYADSGLRLIIWSAAAGIILTRVLRKLMATRLSASHNVSIALKTQFGEAVVDAYIDTGNSLLEPISLQPVIVADVNKLPMLFPREWNRDWSKNLVSGMRIVPYKSIGCEGFLPAIKSSAKNDRNQYINCYLAAGKLHGHKAIVNGDWLNIS